MPATFSKFYSDDKAEFVSDSLCYLTKYVRSHEELQQLVLVPESLERLPDGSLVAEFQRLQFPGHLVDVCAEQEGADHNQQADAHSFLNCRLTDKQLLDFAVWLLGAVRTLHRHGIYPGDLKPENIGCFQWSDGSIGFCFLDTDGWGFDAALHPAEVVATNVERGCGTEMYLPFWWTCVEWADAEKRKLMDWYACAVVALVVASYVFSRPGDHGGFAADLHPFFVDLRRHTVAASFTGTKSFADVWDDHGVLGTLDDETRELLRHAFERAMHLPDAAQLEQVLNLIQVLKSRIKKAHQPPPLEKKQKRRSVRPLDRKVVKRLSF